MSARLQKLWVSAHRARVTRAAAILGAVVVLGVAVLGIEWLRGARRAEAMDSEAAALQAALVESEATRELRVALAQRETRVRTLRGRGFMSAADRVAWVESVTAAVEALRPLHYKVEVGAEATLPLPPAVQAWYDGRGLAAPRLVANLLQIEVEGLHEVEIQRLVAQARVAGGAVVRIESCRLERRLDSGGLGARCTLRRFALLAPQPMPGAT